MTDDRIYEVLNFIVEKYKYGTVWQKALLEDGISEDEIEFLQEEDLLWHISGGDSKDDVKKQIMKHAVSRWMSRYKKDNAWWQTFSGYALLIILAGISAIASIVQVLMQFFAGK